MNTKIIQFLQLKSGKIRYYFFLFYMLQLFTFFSTSKKYNIFFTSSEIRLVINESGDKNVLYQYYYTTPSDVLVNGISKKENQNQKTYLLESDFNNITLIFENEIQTCNNMFKGLTYISEIDLSNFDSSKVTEMSNMFQGCSNLEKIIFGNINTSSVNSMENLFLNCKKLSSIDLSNFNTSKVEKMNGMFSGCSSIKYIDASSFQTSNVKTMNQMFANCDELISINASSFDISSCSNFEKMFYYSIKLKYLDLSSISTPLGNNLKNMFTGCGTLSYINLKSLILQGEIQSQISTGLSSELKICLQDENTKNSLFPSQIVSSCSHLCFSENIKYDLSDNKCTEKCDDDKLEYKNLCDINCIQGNVYISNGKNICLDELPENYFFDTNEKVYKQCYYTCKKCKNSGNETYNNCEECVDNFISINESSSIENNCYEKCVYYYYFDDNLNYHCTSDFSCPDNYKFIKEKNKCINECKFDEFYKYEYDNYCLEKCPNETIYNEELKKCINIINSSILESSIPFIINIPIINATLTPTINDKVNNSFLNNDLNHLFPNHTTEEIYQIIKNDIIKNFHKEGNEIIINTRGEYVLEITTLKNEIDILKGYKNNTNRLSVIDLKECGDILINSYNLSNYTDLVILKYENYVSDINDKTVQYEVFAFNSSKKLNLTLCSSISIDIYIPVETSEETMKLYKDLKSKRFNLFDKNDKFYTDICTPYKSQIGTDVLLSDRYNDFYKSNELSCRENCEYSEYLFDAQYLKCECDIIEQDQIETEDPEKFSAKSIANTFINVLKYSNYKVLKCKSLVFNKNIFSKNLGNILTLIYFLGEVFSFILFCFKRTNYLKIEIWKLYENKELEINISKNINIFFDDNTFKNKNEIKSKTVNNKEENHKNLLLKKVKRI